MRICKATSVKPTRGQLDNSLPSHSLKKLRCILMPFCVAVASHSILFISPSVSFLSKRIKEIKGHRENDFVRKQLSIEQIPETNKYKTKCDPMPFTYKAPVEVMIAVCLDPQEIPETVKPTNPSTRRGVECPDSFPCPSLPYIPPPQVNKSPLLATAAV